MTQSQPHALFEVSFEVCNKLGGIHTVISSKARTLVERFGDRYLCVGPWLQRDEDRPQPPFTEDGPTDDPAVRRFLEQCREDGVPVRLGRWEVPGRPRALLVDFSNQYERKDEILGALWESYQVSSIEGDWDYFEPVLFGHAAAIALQRWWESQHAARGERVVAQFHEWMTGSGLLELKRSCPAIGTVFTTHATTLGRALSAGQGTSSPAVSESGDLDAGSAEARAELAAAHGVAPKHSLEEAAARESDIFTTVSELTASEASRFLARRPEPVTPNGIDVAGAEAFAGDTPTSEVRTRLARAASALLGEDVNDAVFVATGGRYEFHNKGFDLQLDALAEVAAGEGRRVVFFALVPAGHGAALPEWRDRLEGSQDERGPLGIATHHVFAGADDPIAARAAALGIDNSPGSRVLLLHVPVYLGPSDDFVGESYESLVRAMDLTIFPSHYEPWGYTPQESLALGVPTVTSDVTGFGRWARSEGIGPEDGLHTVEREGQPLAESARRLAGTIEAFLRQGPSREEARVACQRAAERSSWDTLIAPTLEALGAASAAAEARLARGVPAQPRMRRTLPARAESRAPRYTTFDVASTLPDELAGLAELARNYAWCWDPEGRDLFEAISPQSWIAAGRNPILFLRNVFPQDLDAAAEDGVFVGKVERVLDRVRSYLAAPPNPESVEDAPISNEQPVAYFSAEYGIHESLRIYSGGLGILSGDHLKSASDIGLPLIGIGLYYRYGYMTQRLTADGEQIAIDVDNAPANLPVEPVLNADGEPLEVRLALPGRALTLRTWRVSVGRVPLYLLDADVDGNRDEDRAITRNLYGGDETTRIQQEIVLGRGGARLLKALGIEPSAWHMNEGHAAFLGVERIARLVREEGLTFDEAREVVRGTTAFTTHTPVPAGHDRFHEDLVRTYFADVGDWLGVPWERFWELGQPTEPAEDERSLFNMTCLAMNCASYVNGVAKLHGATSRELLHSTWPGLLVSEVPVHSITNGVHLPSWIRPTIADLVRSEPRPVRGMDFEASASAVDPGDLWAARQDAKRAFTEHLRRNLKESFVARHDSPALLARMLDGVDDGALWIGFARRFAPYKRAHLTFSDVDRLRRILDSEDRPVRIVVAGKAHPRDARGKEIVREIARLCRSDEFAGRVFVAEDYDVTLARALVQGVDVWLNTPTRPLEASGTSGMKAAANGALNLSIADGWWPEGWDGDNGWTIGGDRTFDDQALQDQLDAETLYRLLEEEVVPLFFERDGAGLPQGWLRRSRHALETLPPVFDTDRMVSEYAREAYRPLAVQGARLAVERRRPARVRAADKARLRAGLAAIRVIDARLGELGDFKVGDTVSAHVVLDLGQLSAGDVRVELVVGHQDGDGELTAGRTIELERSGGPDNAAVFDGGIAVERSGRFGCGLRLRPRDLDGDPTDLLRDQVRWIG